MDKEGRDAVDNLMLTINLMGFIRNHHPQLLTKEFDSVLKERFYNIAYTLEVRSYTNLLCLYGIHFFLGVIEYMKSLEDYETCRELIDAIHSYNLLASSQGYDQYPTTIEEVRGKTFKGLFDDTRTGTKRVPRKKVL